MLTPLQSIVAAELRRRQPLNPSTKLGYHLAITAMATALERIDGLDFDRNEFIEACAVPTNARRQLELTTAESSA